MVSFDAGCDRLAEVVGFGELVGKVKINQVYAAALERGYWVSGPLAGHANHPRHGGEQHYLEHSLEDNRAEFLQHLADNVLDEDGLYGAMVDNMEVTAAQVAVRAPVEFGDLRNSGHPSVEDDGAVVYDRPPVVERLSRAEMAAKARLLSRAHETRRRAGHPWSEHH